MNTDLYSPGLVHIDTWPLLLLVRDSSMHAVLILKILGQFTYFSIEELSKLCTIF